MRAPVRTRHTRRVPVDAEVIHHYLGDVTQWPHTFAPTVHAEVLERRAEVERVQLWALANGAVRTWISRRVLGLPGYPIFFAQEPPASPLQEMTGSWLVIPVAEGESEVILTHQFTTLTAADEDHVRRAVDANSTAELAGLDTVADYLAHPEALLQFEDSQHIAAPLEVVHAFLWSADAWPERLGHVAAVDLTEDDGVQRLAMTTRSPDGGEHGTVSFRVAPRPGVIAYKQTEYPPIMRAHAGRWLLERATDGGTLARSAHSVRLDPQVAAAHGGTEQAGRLVRNALSTNSRRTLAAAKAHCEAGAAVGTGR